MGRLIKGERDEGNLYTLKRSKGIIQKMERLDFCEYLIAPEYKKNVTFEMEYKFFNLQVEAKILIIPNNSLRYIDYWRGYITVLDKRDKIRVKNLLYPLIDLYIHGQWTEITDEKLTFKCNHYNDNYLKLNDDKELYFGRSPKDLPDCSFKSHDWLIEEMKKVIDQVY